MLSGTCIYKGHLDFLWIIGQTRGRGRQPALMGHELKLKLRQVADGLGYTVEKTRRCRQNIKALNARQKVRIMPFSTFQ